MNPNPFDWEKTHLKGEQPQGLSPVNTDFALNADGMFGHRPEDKQMSFVKRKIYMRRLVRILCFGLWVESGGGCKRKFLDD